MLIRFDFAESHQNINFPVPAKSSLKGDNYVLICALKQDDQSAAATLIAEAGKEFIAHDFKVVVLEIAPVDLDQPAILEAHLTDALARLQEHGAKSITILGHAQATPWAIWITTQLDVHALICWSVIWEPVESASSLIFSSMLETLGRIETPKLLFQGTAGISSAVEKIQHLQASCSPPAFVTEMPDADVDFSYVYHRRQVIRQTLIWLKRILMTH